MYLLFIIILCCYNFFCCTALYNIDLYSSGSRSVYSAYNCLHEQQSSQDGRCRVAANTDVSDKTEPRPKLISEKFQRPDG